MIAASIFYTFKRQCHCKRMTVTGYIKFVCYKTSAGNKFRIYILSIVTGGELQGLKQLLNLKLFDQNIYHLRTK
jgi:hypothetical protein